jgi:hypothetical protein
MPNEPEKEFKNFQKVLSEEDTQRVFWEEKILNGFVANDTRICGWKSREIF